MGQTFSRMLAHVIFSTKGRRRFITPDLKERLCPYITRMVQAEFGHPLRINCTDDHLHLLLDMKTAVAPATMLRVIKANSSGWIHKTFPQHAAFAWQSGYGLFSIGESQRDHVIEYIKNQEAHHRKRTFQEEFLDFLRRYNIDYDERYIWD